MYGRGFLFNAAYLGIALVAAAAMWLVLGLFSLTIDAPAQVIVGWFENLLPSPWGSVLFLGLLFGGLGFGARYFGRRDLRRQYAADRTIHVEKLRRFKIRHALMIYGHAFVAFCIAGFFGST